MYGLIFVLSGVTAASVAFSLNWLALVPWRRARAGHWTERARVYYPARVAAAGNLWVLPGVITMASLLIWPEASPHWALILLAASAGTAAGTIPMEREVVPRVGLNDQVRQVAIGWLMRFLLWFVFLSAAAFMPAKFNLLSLAIAVVVLVLLILWNRDGWIYVGEWLGLFLRMPARPVEMVQSIASKMNVPLREIYLMRSSAAQALALPNRQRLVFTDRLIEILTEAELAAVAAHELGHLTEARGDYYKRYVVWCFALPWIFLKPVLHACGVAGFLLLLCTSMLALSLFRKFSHKLELRADSIAKSRELDEGCYATALLKLYEDNLLPAVNANKRSTHPHLYDRVETAGITPDFPRPAPPSTMSWPLLLTSIALGILAVELIERVLGHL